MRSESAGYVACALRAQLAWSAMYFVEKRMILRKCSPHGILFYRKAIQFQKREQLTFGKRDLMNESLIIVIVLLILDLPLFILIGKLMYSGWDDFGSDFKWNLIPDIFSVFTGRFLRDKSGEFNSQFFMLICFIILFLELLIAREVLY